MSIPLQPLLRYWRAALLDATRHIDPESLTLYGCSREQLSAGRIEGEALSGVWRDAEAGMKAKERKEVKSINILVAPQMLEPRHDHAAQFSTQHRCRIPLWVPAKLDRDGRLLPPSYGGPMVDRAVLAPLASKAATFATVEGYDSFLDKNPVPSADAGWSPLWDHVRFMYRTLFGDVPEQWTPNGHVNLGAFVASGNLPIDSTGAIRKLYETLIEALADNEDAPALLARLSHPAPSLDVQSSPQCQAALHHRHLGQMAGDYPLNYGQRQTLSAVLAAKDGDIVAVNGPPGTGKTTLIQSIVASLWVERALVKDGEPPVILASSTNNKAITNILDSFEQASLPEGHPLASSRLIERWLPQVSQYGLFLPSKEQIKKGLDVKYAHAWCDNYAQPWAGLPGQIESQDFVDGAEAHWQEAFRDWNGGTAEGMDSAIETLRNTLVERVGGMARAQSARSAFVTAAENFALAKPYSDSVIILSGELTSLRQQLAELRRHGHAAMERIQGSILESLLSWLPPIRRRLWGKAYAFLDAQGLADPAWSWDTIMTAADLRTWLVARIAMLERQAEGHLAVVHAWSHWWEAVAALDLASVAEQPEDLIRLESTLDTLIRPGLFHLAARYWEGRWLLEMKQSLARVRDGERALIGRNRAFSQNRWRRFAKVTPCLVSTAFTAPRLFDCYEGNQSHLLLDFIDLLIIDEAGQVPTQTGGALLALARKAVVIGDVLQIEPVWGITADIDDGNLAKHDMLESRAEIEASGLLAAEGSVMAAARAATAFSIGSHRGLFLDQHWRCRDSVIAYCNHLAYDRALVPMRGDTLYPLPPLGHAHVSGRAAKAGTSRINEDEATVIAIWLKRRQAELMAHHANDKKPPRNLGAIVAVITPFKAQIGVIRKALKAAGLDNEDITVGTVHTLQGAEKPVVLFSSVYNADDAGRLFFDRGVSMLNVAVSRARESFLVFGDLRLFRPAQPSLPSGLLARFLFADPGNEITDIEPTTPLARHMTRDMERLDDLERHRHILRHAIEDAKQRLLVVSPYLSDVAIEADMLIPALKQATDRKIRVVVAFDPHLNSGSDGRLRDRASKALEALTAAKVETWALNGAHNKTLAVDDRWIVEGSFNWLAAARSRDHGYSRHEASILYRGDEAANHTDSAWGQAEALRMEQ